MNSFEEKSILELQKMMESGDMTSEELTSWYIKRIMKYSACADGLNAVLELNPDALQIAAALDRERELSGPRGPMHGIPVLLKDNISTGDKMHTTAGAGALADNLAADDSEVARTLRDNGAVIMGKANLSEFARFIASEFPDGYSYIGGQTVCPYGREFNPGGSSSGSAVAAAANLCAAAVGTETDGSITHPAGNNAVCGLKPTLGLVSRSGIIPINMQDTAGPIARTVEDCAVMLTAMVTHEDQTDPVTLSLPEKVYCDYTEFLDKDALKGLRVGVDRAGFVAELFPEGSMELFEKELLVLKDLGADLVDCDLEWQGPGDAATEAGDVASAEEAVIDQAMLICEFRMQMDAYLARYATGKCRTLKDIVEHNKEHPECVPYGQDLLEASLEVPTGRLIDPAYWGDRFDTIENGAKAFDRIMEENKLDLFVAPTYHGVAPKIGYPVIIVPMGKTPGGMPAGMSFFGGAFSEPVLIGAAYAYEQATKHRTPPVLDR